MSAPAAGSSRNGRGEIVNRADHDALRRPRGAAVERCRTVTFLTDQCCAGVTLVRDDAA